MNFGLQPRCFDFFKNKNDNIKLFDFSLSQSNKSGLLQLANPIPAKSLHPKYSWIRNKEPDDHANLIAEEILKYTANGASTVLFLSKFDQKVYFIVTITPFIYFEQVYSIFKLWGC